MLQAGGHALSFEANTALMPHSKSLRTVWRLDMLEHLSPVGNLLPSEHAGTWRTAHGRGHEGVCERRPTFFQDAARLIHGLHGAYGGVHKWLARS